ncbi:MAG: flagellar basal body L-ring protein FlgH [Bdellovibrionales bacterium]|nr:flagellar basal body L-ring protein FlgH [Bdellovibrionales bacterium]
MKKLTFLFIPFLFVLSGCAEMMGNLRPEYDDSDPYARSNGPTVGGRWSERQMLDDRGGYPEDRYGAVGHSERNPASIPLRGDDGYSNEEVDPETGVPIYSAQANVEPPMRRFYKNGARATRSDFVDDSSNDGSLWASDGQTNYYFTKNKVRGVGDILSVTIEKEFHRDIMTELTRTLSQRERDMELELAQERIKNGNVGADKVGSSAASPERAPAAANGEKEKKDTEEKSARTATWADVDVSKSTQLKEGDTVMSEIVERYPNGNYKIRGTKRIPYRNGFRSLAVSAIVKGSDLGDEDTVPSGKLYEYRLEVTR